MKINICIMENLHPLGIYFDDKFLIIPKSAADMIFKNAKQKCDYCRSEGKMMRCGVCQSVYYCSKKCQKADYKEHKVKCKNIFEHKHYDNYKTYFYNKILANVFIFEILTTNGLPSKFKKKKFWQMLINPRNDDYIFTSCSYEEMDIIIERNKTKNPSFDTSNYIGFVSDLNNQYNYNFVR